jgi:hypothetical protein
VQLVHDPERPEAKLVGLEDRAALDLDVVDDRGLRGKGGGAEQSERCAQGEG